MVNLRFNFKMDLADISTIDFAFADTYAELETDPFLTKSYPEDGTHSQRSIILTLSAEEAELLPEQFYALATVNFENGETIKAHAFKNTAKEEVLSASLALEDTEYNINFFIDEVVGSGSYTAGNGIDISNDTISTKVVSTSDNLLSVNSTGLIVSKTVLGYDQTIREGLVNTNASNPLATKTYVDNLMSGAVKRLVVESLPTQNIDTNTIYMILKSVPSTNNIYDEYMYINNAWELIGSTEVDLSNYYTKSESNNRYPLKTNIYTKTEVNAITLQKAFRNLSSASYIMEQSESSAVALNVANYDTLKITATTMPNNNHYKLDNDSTVIFARADLPLTIDVSSASKFYAWCGFGGELLTYDLTNTDFDYATKSEVNAKQDTIDTTHKLSADLVADGSNYMVIPKPTAADEGKVLQVNSNGQPEWVTP